MSDSEQQHSDAATEGINGIENPTTADPENNFLDYLRQKDVRSLIYDTREPTQGIVVVIAHPESIGAPSEKVKSQLSDFLIHSAAYEFTSGEWQLDGGAPSDGFVSQARAIEDVCQTKISSVEEGVSLDNTTKEEVEQLKSDGYSTYKKFLGNDEIDAAGVKFLKDTYDADLIFLQPSAREHTASPGDDAATEGADSDALASSMPDSSIGTNQDPEVITETMELKNPDQLNEAMAEVTKRLRAVGSSPSTAADTNA